MLDRQASMGYLFLSIAIAGEVVATSFLKLASGENSRWWAYLIVAVGYVLAFVMLSLTLSNGVPLGIAYAIWAGVGVVLVALISWIVFHELLSWQQVVGIALVIGGVVLLELGGDHHHETPAAAATQSVVAEAPEPPTSTTSAT
jgi:small multidrug resistance pump